MDPLLAAFVFLLLFGFTSPIPEELALVIVGLALRGAGRGYLEILPIALLALALSDIIYYSIARFFGSRLLRIRFLRGILKPERIEASERFFARKGPKIVFACRFVVGLRFAAIVSAGILRMPLKRLLAYDLPALCIGAPAWLGVGYAIAFQLGGADIGIIGTILSVCGPLAVFAAAILVYKKVAAERGRPGRVLLLPAPEAVQAPRSISGVDSCVDCP